MSLPDQADIEYESGTSNCCDAKVYRDLGICKECGEHCELVKDVDEMEKLQEMEIDTI